MATPQLVNKATPTAAPNLIDFILLCSFGRVAFQKQRVREKAVPVPLRRAKEMMLTLERRQGVSARKAPGRGFQKATGYQKQVAGLPGESCGGSAAKELAGSALQLPIGPRDDHD